MKPIKTHGPNDNPSPNRRYNVNLERGKQNSNNTVVGDNNVIINANFGITINA